MSFTLDLTLSLAIAVGRSAGCRIDQAVEGLASARENPEKGPHTARKRFKEIRAVLRLVEGDNSALCRKTERWFRDAGRLLAGAREATALIETVDRLAHAGKKHGDHAFTDLRATLLARRDAMLEHGLDEATLQQAIAACEAGRLDLSRLALPADADAAAALLAEGMANALRRARKALKAAKCQGRADDFHALRKTIKVHLVHVSLLGDILPKGKVRHAALDALSEDLGRLNDLFVLAAFLKAEPGLAPPAEIARLKRARKRSAGRLRKATLRQAAQLLRGTPRELAAAVAAACQEAAAAGSRPALAGVDVAA